MSNENNEEIELFDYMDEESESRKIPVNKKEKTGGKRVADQRKKRKSRSTYMGWKSCGNNRHYTCTYYSMALRSYGGSCIWTFKEQQKISLYCLQETSDDRIPRYFCSQEEIDAIKAANSIKDTDEVTDTSLVVLIQKI